MQRAISSAIKMFVFDFIREQFAWEKFRCRGPKCRAHFLPNDFYGKISPQPYGDTVVSMMKEGANIHQWHQIATGEPGGAETKKRGALVQKAYKPKNLGLEKW